MLSRGGFAAFQASMGTSYTSISSQMFVRSSELRLVQLFSLIVFDSEKGQNDMLFLVETLYFRQLHWFDRCDTTVSQTAGVNW